LIWTEGLADEIVQRNKRYGVGLEGQARSSESRVGHGLNEYAQAIGGGTKVSHRHVEAPFWTRGTEQMVDGGQRPNSSLDRALPVPRPDMRVQAGHEVGRAITGLPVR
jgi:hypothetical protein